MVACYDENAPPPGPLMMAWHCERWHCLPEGGGMMDQDYRMMREMAACANVYNALSRLRNALGEQIHQLSDNDREILGLLVRLGLLFHE